MWRRTSLAGLLTVLGLAAPASPERVFVERDGVVSMEAENASWSRGFDRVPGLSGDAVRCREDSLKQHDEKTAVLRFEIEFNSAGKYAIWLLGRIEKKQYAGNEFGVELDRPDDLEGRDPKHKQYPGPADWEGKTYTRMTTGYWMEPATTEFHWASKMKTGGVEKDFVPPAAWTIEKPGRHRLDFIARNEGGWILDKIVIQRVDPRTPPTGKGPAETRR
ncbi:MAG: hypothetical protein MUC42_11690 [Bryobacter sp.]|nr:hypothetical protein [Bryobacter sp.]